jgi:recombination protein RecR
MKDHLLQELISAMRCLPGIGAKSAQRMVFHLLSRDRQAGKRLAELLAEGMEKILYCTHCRLYTETPVCYLCQNPQRSKDQICIVETPADLYAIETTGYRGSYFVLHGKLSPIDGINPEHLGISLLKTRLLNEMPQEIILATNPTVEGIATAHYIADIAKKMHIKCSRIAHGVPLGGEIEYIDGGTLLHALTGREVIE